MEIMKKSNKCKKWQKMAKTKNEKKDKKDKKNQKNQKNIKKFFAVLFLSFFFFLIFSFFFLLFLILDLFVLICIFLFFSINIFLFFIIFFIFFIFLLCSFFGWCSVSPIFFAWCCLVSSFFGWCCCFPSPVWWCCLPSPPLGSGACLHLFCWVVLLFFLLLFLEVLSSFSSFGCGCVLHLFCWVVLLGLLLPFGWCCCLSFSCLVVLPSIASFGSSKGTVRRLWQSRRRVVSDSKMRATSGTATTRGWFCDAGTSETRCMHSQQATFLSPWTGCDRRMWWVNWRVKEGGALKRGVLSFKCEAWPAGWGFRRGSGLLSWMKFSFRIHAPVRVSGALWEGRNERLNVS